MKEMKLYDRLLINDIKSRSIVKPMQAYTHILYILTFRFACYIAYFIALYLFVDT